MSAPDLSRGVAIALTEAADHFLFAHLEKVDFQGLLSHLNFLLKANLNVFGNLCSRSMCLEHIPRDGPRGTQ